MSDSSPAGESMWEDPETTGEGLAELSLVAHATRAPSM